MYTHITCLHVYLLYVFAHVLHCPYAHMHALCVSVYTGIGACYRYCVCLCVHTHAIYLHVHMQATCSWYVVEPQAEGRGQEEQGGPLQVLPASLTLRATLAPSWPVSMILRGLPTDLGPGAPGVTAVTSWVGREHVPQLRGGSWALQSLQR